MTLNRKQILDLHNGLYAVGDLTGAKFSYAVARNIKILKFEVDALQKVYKIDPAYLVFEKERSKLGESHAVKVDGVPKTSMKNGKEGFVLKNQEAFDKDLKVLEGKHSVVVRAREKQTVDFERLLKGRVKIDLHMILFNNVPEEITPKQMSGILHIVTENLTK